MSRNLQVRGWLRAANLTALLAVAIGLTAGGGTAVAACPNEAFRTGASTGLPDCRAYELITPRDSEGRNFFTLEAERLYNLFPSRLVSPMGESAVFMTNGRPLKSPGGASGVDDVYQSVRTADGWEVIRRITPSGVEATFPLPGGLSSDHRFAFVGAVPGVAGSSGGTLAEENAGSYLSNPDGTFEFVGIGSLGTERAAIGRYISGGGEHIIFTTTSGNFCPIDCPLQQLEPDAAPSGTEAIYDRAPDGPTHVISLLPGDVPLGAGENAAYLGVSADGTVVAFRVNGVLYVRINNSETKEVVTGEATYAGLTADGSRLFYVTGGNVFAFDTASGAGEEIIGTGDAELVNISTDGSHAYFISRTALAGAGGGEAGQPNLYVYSRQDGSTRFVATVLQADLEGEPALNRWTTDAVNADISGSSKGPAGDTSRTTPDGEVIVFESRAKLTAYENQEHVEIYRYDAPTGQLRCLSCNPSGASAVADARLEAVRKFGNEATIVDNLTSDGTRVFFETTEGLTAKDTDGVNDIYEWQTTPGGTSLSLISTGQSVLYENAAVPFLNFPEPNVLFGVTPSGSDVVFRTGDPLIPGVGGGGTEGIYDARIGGGFAEPALPCSSQPCTELTNPPPSFLAPASRSFRGKGNFRGRHRCHRVRHKHRSSGKRPAKHRRCIHRHKKGASK